MSDVYTIRLAAPVPGYIDAIMPMFHRGMRLTVGADGEKPRVVEVVEYREDEGELDVREVMR